MRGDHPDPHGAGGNQRDADRRRTHVLDALDRRVDVAADAIGELLDRRVEQFDDQQKDQHGDQREPLARLLGDEKRKRCPDDEQRHFLAEGRLGLRGGKKAVPAVERGFEEPLHARPPESRAYARHVTRPLLARLFARYNRCA